MLELVVQDGLPGTVSVEWKNQRVKYKTPRISRGEMLTKKFQGVEQGDRSAGKEGKQTLNTRNFRSCSLSTLA